MTKLECCIPKAGILVPELCLLFRVVSLIMTLPCFVYCHSQNALSYTVKITPSLIESCFITCSTPWKQRRLWFRICPYNLWFDIHCHGPWGIKEQIFTEPSNLPEILPGSLFCILSSTAYNTSEDHWTSPAQT